MLDSIHPNQTHQIIRDTIAGFLADIDHMAEGEPRLVILQKPGMHLVMLGGSAREKAELPHAGTLSTAQALDLARRAPELRAKADAEKAEQIARSLAADPRPLIDQVEPIEAEPATEESYRGFKIQYSLSDEGWTYYATDGKQGWNDPRPGDYKAARATAHARIDHELAKIPPKPPKAPTAATPKAEAEAQLRRTAGQKYRCAGCTKTTHKALTLVQVRDIPGVDMAYLCKPCQTERHIAAANEAPGKPQDRKPPAAAVTTIAAKPADPSVEAGQALQQRSDSPTFASKLANLF